MNYRTNFVIFGMIHRHVIYFMKCHFLQFWWAVRESFPQLSEPAFRILLSFATTHLCESGFSALVHIKVKARNQRKVEHDKRLMVSTANTQPRISKLPYTVAQSIFVLKMFVKFNCRSKLTVIKCIFVVVILW